MTKSLRKLIKNAAYDECSIQVNGNHEYMKDLGNACREKASLSSMFRKSCV